MSMNPYSVDYYPVEEAIELGRRIGKVPLVCDGNAQSFIAAELWWRYGIRERETVQERDERQRCAYRKALDFAFSSGHIRNEVDGDQIIIIDDYEL